MLKFFDCNAFLGRSARRAAYQPVPSAEAFLGEMDFCGVDKALVWHIAQFDASPQSGNELISKAIQPHPRLLGCWSLLPNHAHLLIRTGPVHLSKVMRELGSDSVS